MRTFRQFLVACFLVLPGSLSSHSVDHTCSAIEPTPYVEPVVVIPGLHHLRSGVDREWAEFPENASGDSVSKQFSVKQPAGDWTLQVRQQDVKQNWEVVLNEQSLGKLVINENDMRIYLEVPPGLVRHQNQISVRPRGEHRASDDIRVGELSLISGNRVDVLSESSIRVTVRDDTEAKIPARITLTRDGALQSLANESTRTTAVRPGVLYTSDGVADIRLPAGRYRIVVGRGFEYSISDTRIEVRPDEKLEHDVVISRAVDTNGWIACDTHVHTLTHSGHGDATVQERMVTIAGEGIELPIATDHNVQIDHRPFANEAGVQRFFTPVIGNEVTTKTGHFNIFPVAKDAPVPSHKSDVWKETFDGIYQLPTVRVAIIDHARDLHGGTTPFGPKHFNEAAGEMLDDWHVGFNAMEIINSGATQTDPLQLTRDWMALLNRGHRITPVGCSDSHDVARHFVGQGRTYIRCDDADPGNIDITNASDAFAAGKVSVSYGLMIVGKIGNAGSGELVSAKGNELELQLRVYGPKWVLASEVRVYLNGEQVETVAIPESAGKSPEGLIWQGTVSVTHPGHDAFVTAVALGPGIKSLHWPCAKPYQPDSAFWDSRVMGCMGAIFVDFDQDGRWASAYDLARELVENGVGSPENWLPLLDQRHPSIATQAASIWHGQSGESPIELLGNKSLVNCSAKTVKAIRAYAAAWRDNEIARGR